MNVVTQLPAGVSGLIIAGIFAAAQSTISSSLNAVASCFVVDFKQRYFNHAFRKISDVALARWVIIISGLLATCVTIYFVTGNQSSTWEIFLAVSGMFGVPVAGLFVLGIFTKRANSKGVLIGFLISVVISFIANNMGISSLLVATIALLSSIVFGYLFSFIFKQDKNLNGLTIYSLNK
ncbi:sodium:solute symporter family transporter [Aerococcus suis]|uniref:sodium:solute symporter family transporter n=1 Tax=Aerococcus suis TaxID=371602 RepID=UPI000A05DDCE|nr:hypothetical protein [Aerococcus suis]MDY4646365.1 hypothetical protein [Aerococcus suis]